MVNVTVSVESPGTMVGYGGKEECMDTRRPRLLAISEAADRLGIHPDTLRAWADKGHVGVIRTPTGYRRFDPDEIERVRAEMGMTRQGKALAA